VSRTPAAPSFTRAGLVLLAGALPCCTTRETGAIDLGAPSGAPSAEKPPPPPSGPECTTDPDCASEPTRRTCDTVASRCVECVTDQDCDAGKHCTVDDVCGP